MTNDLEIISDQSFSENDMIPSEEETEKKERPPTYINLILHLMQGYGDCSCPLYESAFLIEGILRQQMESLLSQLLESAKLQGNTKINYKDVIYLLQKNEHKLRSLLKFIILNDPNDDINKGIYKKETTDSITYRIETSSRSEKRQKLCRSDSSSSISIDSEKKQSKSELVESFLKYIEGTKRISNIVNEVREEIVTEKLYKKMPEINVPQTLQDPNYLAYQKARQAMFIVDNFKDEEFKNWLFQNKKYELDDFAFEMIGYLAQQTIATVIQLALFVKRDKKQNLIERIEMPKPCNTDFASYRLISSMFSKRYGGQTTDYYQCGIKHFCSLFFKPENEILGYSPNAITPDDIVEVLFRFYSSKGPFDLRSVDQRKKKLFCA